MGTNHFTLSVMKYFFPEFQGILESTLLVKTLHLEDKFTNSNEESPEEKGR